MFTVRRKRACALLEVNGRLETPFPCVPLKTKANSGSKPAAGGPHGPQQTALHHAGAEGGSAGEEPAQSAAHGGSGGAAAVQEVGSELWLLLFFIVNHDHVTAFLH